MNDQVRVLRLLEYEGDRESIENTLNHRGVEGEKRIGQLFIREVILGDFPTIISKGDKTWDKLGELWGAGKITDEVMNELHDARNE